MNYRVDPRNEKNTFSARSSRIFVGSLKKLNASLVIHIEFEILNPYSTDLIQRNFLNNRSVIPYTGCKILHSSLIYSTIQLSSVPDLFTSHEVRYVK